MRDVNSSVSRVRVLFVCTGLGIIDRGIETFFRSAFDGLKGIAGLQLRLVKSAGVKAPEECAMRNLARTGLPARLFGALARRNGYVVEQWTSLLSVIAQIRQFRPQVIFYSDANLGFLLFRLRRWIGVRYTLLFSNGGPVHPPFVRTDYVHQVAPCYYDAALAAGEPRRKHFMVPYGLEVIPVAPILNGGILKIRARLGLPLDRKIVLSVGWIRNFHKRMGYVIEEIARLPKPRPFLQLLGHMDHGSTEIIDLGNRLLGLDGFAARCVPHENVFDYYQSSDCFVLASLKEGFGRVYLEALMYGLPVIAHQNVVTEFVLGSHGVLGELTKTGELTLLLQSELQKPADSRLAHARWRSVRDRFSWSVLAPSYRAMFHACASMPTKTSSGLSLPFASVL